MRREFDDNDLKTLWQATWQGLTKRQMMHLLGYTEAEYLKAFHQARIKFSAPVILPKVKPQKDVIKHKPYLM